MKTNYQEKWILFLQELNEKSIKIQLKVIKTKFNYLFIFWTKISRIFNKLLIFRNKFIEIQNEKFFHSIDKMIKVCSCKEFSIEMFLSINSFFLSLEWNSRLNSKFNFSENLLISRINRCFNSLQKNPFYSLYSSRNL